VLLEALAIDGLESVLQVRRHELDDLLTGKLAF
jgi:hypothetical protein